MNRRSSTARRVAGLAVLMTLTVATALTPTSPVTAAPDHGAALPRAGQDTTWAGFKIRGNGTAGGGWVGGRQLDDQIVYRIDPARKAVSTTYGPAGAADVGGTASPEDAARAAYILSRYGTFKYAVQAAAVDVAVTSLLAPKPYAVKGPKTKKRLRQVRARGKVLKFARVMLKAAARNAGAPVLGVSVTDAPVGEQIQATATLHDAHGQPLDDKEIRFEYPGGSTQVVRTDKSGMAVAKFTAAGGGRKPATATALGLTEWRLVLRQPADAKASRLARAGMKTDLSATGTSVVAVQPTVRVTSPGQGMFGSPAPGQFVVSGGQPGNRTATLRLFGPFANPPSACTGPVVATQTVTVTGNGTYDAPPTKPSLAGYYAWEAAVAGDDVNKPASACGNPIVIQTQPVVMVAQEPDVVTYEQTVKPRVMVYEVPSNQSYQGTAVVTFYGPFPSKASATCDESARSKRDDVPVTGIGDYYPPGKTFGQEGFFSMQVTLPAGTFSLAASSVCRDGASIFKVKPE